MAPLKIISIWTIRVACIVTGLLFLTAAKVSPVDGQIFSSEKSFTDVSLNLQLGQQAPNFSLNSMNMKKVDLSAFKDKQNVLLVFYRGAWCPYCVSHFDDIQNIFPSLLEHNVQLLAISPDNDEKSRKLAKRFSQPYLFLSDADLSVTEKYGIKSDKRLPHPSVFLINKQGLLVWYYVSKDHTVGPSGLQLKAMIETQLD